MKLKLGALISALAQLYIPLGSDETKPKPVALVKLFVFISHLVQMKQRISEKS